MTRRILILGATSGIAMEASRCFAKENAKIFLVARDYHKLSAIADDLRIRGAESVETQQADLTDYSVYPQIIARVFTVWGGLDAALIAHGILPDQIDSEADPAALCAALKTNYVSVILLLMELANAFEKQGFGIIAVIGSVAGDRGRRSNYVYGSAKAGLATFADGLRLRLKVAGVNVVFIKPGWVNTPMTVHLKQNFLFASSKQVGYGVYRAIIFPRSVVYLPWYWKWVMKIIRLVPEPIFAKLDL